MTEIEKGYKCPSLEDCSKCAYYKDLCIVYGKTGKKKLKKHLDSKKHKKDM